MLKLKCGEFRFDLRKQGVDDIDVFFSFDQTSHDEQRAQRFHALLKQTQQRRAGHGGFGFEHRRLNQIRRKVFRVLVAFGHAATVAHMHQCRHCCEFAKYRSVARGDLQISQPRRLQ